MAFSGSVPSSCTLCPPAEPFVRVFLLGLRGTGKTTLAPILAQHLDWDWCDMDAELEQRYRRTIQEIFEQEGELGFRDKEAELLQEICQREHVVVATGGGVVVREANRQLLRQQSRCIWLRASIPVMASRLASDPTTASRRPALTALPAQEELRALLHQREPLYQACADLIVDTDRASPAELAAWILQQLAKP